MEGVNTRGVDIPNSASGREGGREEREGGAPGGMEGREEGGEGRDGRLEAPVTAQGLGSPRR